jgi:hypothetical protein
MKTLWTAVVLTGMGLLPGCGSGGTGGAKQGAVQLSGAPALTELRYGNDDQKVPLTVGLPADFKGEVKLTVEVAPKDQGVTARISPETIKPAGSKNADLHISTEARATAGDYTITVTARPSDGTPSTLEVKCKLPPKE